MATGAAPISLSLELPSGRDANATNAVLAAMLRTHPHVSDLIFSPGRVPQIEVNGQLMAIETKGLRTLNADDTRRIAADLIGSNKQAITTLREQGACDISYGLPELARFRVNVFIQRGSCAVVIRVIPTEIRDVASLRLPSQLEAISSFNEGIVLITGPRNSGKSSTLAAVVDRINSERLCHIVTIEDPIEFLHNHKKATVHQRELHSDTPSISMALQSALRQSPNVIQVSDARDRETMEMILEAAETGHLVLCALNTPDVAKTLDKLIHMFGASEYGSTRSRLAKTLRMVVSQRLLPARNGNGRVLAAEVLTVNAAVREILERNDFVSKQISDFMAKGSDNDIQDLDTAISRLVADEDITLETACTYATDPERLRAKLSSN